MTPAIGYIVEGYGDVAAVPVMVRLIASSLDPPVFPLIPEPVRADPRTLLDPSAQSLERAIKLAAGKASQSLEKRGLEGRIAIHIVIDREQDRPEDCPAHLGPQLLHRAVELRSDIPIAVTLAKQEFEAWFLAAAESLAGYRDLPANLRSPPDPESIRGAKEWLGRQMRRTYYEREDQPALAAVLDRELARRRSKSFDKFFRDTLRLLMG